MKKYSLLLLALGLAACHPLGCWHPKPLPSDHPRELSSEDSTFPIGDVEIMIDDLGIPHIFADNDADLSYGLGYMHGRDRTWQLLFMRHVSQGRLSELFGESFLSADQFLRLNSFAADRALASMSPGTLSRLEAYVAGVNLAAKERGPTAEMDLLGVEFGQMQARDAVTILLHFVYDQSVAAAPELARIRVLNRLGPDHPVARILLDGVLSGGVPIVTDEAHSGARPGVQAQTARVRSTTYRRDTTLPRKASPPELSEDARRIAGRYFQPQGNSNSFVVSGELTASGSPILANDPHLGHQAPGIFYLAHLEGPDFTITGGTFPGAPAVLIGSGRDIAWGITNAYGDCEDFARIERVEGADDLYLLDGRPMNFGHVVQQYKLGKEDDAPIFEETWETTVFGPLLPKGREFLLDEGDDVAYQWCAIEYADQMDGDLSMWWDLARARNIEEADAALSRFVAPPLSFALAFTDGTIAQRVVGRSPSRRSNEPIHLPRDGRFRDAGWGDPIPYDQKPQLTNPESGIIVAANQRIVENDSVLEPITGREGGDPLRALRITERLTTLIGQKRPNANDVLDIQQDVESVEARALASILGDRCPDAVRGHPRERVLGFCTALRNFDGRFTVDSLGALPFQLTMTRLADEVSIAHLGPDVGPRVGDELRMRALILEEIQKERSPLFDDPNLTGSENLDALIARSVRVALDRLVEVGPTPVDWQWGKLHTLQFENPLSSAPVIGGLFKSPIYQESGCQQCVRSEGPLPVETGAGLRLIAEMTSPPTVRMIGDLGQVGHFGAKNSEDMYPKWTAGEPVEIPTTREAVERKRAGWLLLKAR